MIALSALTTPALSVAMRVGAAERPALGERRTDMQFGGVTDAQVVLHGAAAESAHVHQCRGVHQLAVVVAGGHRLRVDAECDCRVGVRSP